MSKAATVEHNYSHPMGKLQRKLLVRAVAQGGIRALRCPGLYDKYLQRYEAAPWLGFYSVLLPYVPPSAYPLHEVRHEVRNVTQTKYIAAPRNCC